MKVNFILGENLSRDFTNEFGSSAVFVNELIIILNLYQMTYQLSSLRLLGLAAIELSILYYFYHIEINYIRIL